MDYEKNIEELNKIMLQLNDENISIEKSLTLFERAGELYKECSAYLKEAKGNIYKIKQDLNNYKEEKFDWIAHKLLFNILCIKFA